MTMNRSWRVRSTLIHCCVSVVISSVAVLLSGCGGSTGSGSTTSKFNGVAKGSVSSSSSTRESLDAASGSAQQVLPGDIDAAVVRVTFETLDGGPLLDVAGQPYAASSVDATGAFSVDGLPVAVDFVVAVDLDGDGTPDIRHIIQIPVDATGTGGQLENIVVDPLTTLIVSKLNSILQQSGIDAADLEISPTAIVERIVDAFTHMFEESGFDQSLTIEDIEGLTAANVEELFAALLPATVRSGIETVEGTIALEAAGDISGALRAAAEVFLRAGFPIADEPGGVDLSFLGDLPDVQVASIDQLFGGEDPFMDPGTDPFLDPTGSAAQALLDGGLPVIYLSTVTEPDRNFVVNNEFEKDGDGPRLPILKEKLLARMAQLHLEDRVITLRDLYNLLTNETIGLGVRLTYSPPMHGFDGPPPLVFETATGEGVAIDVDRILFDLLDSGLFDPSIDVDSFEAEEQLIRDKMRELLVGTVPPSMDRLFGALLSDRIETTDQLFSFIRKAKVHLPFSRSGPSNFFVIADGDKFRPDAGAVNPVSVDVEFGADGKPVRVTYNSAHTGAFYLGFSFDTEINNGVQLLVRETGFFLHGPNGGPVFANMGDAAVFQPINGVPFADFVSEEGEFWPGVPVSVSNPEHRIDATSTDGFNDATTQLFVLAVSPGQESDPVRVDFDLATGTFSASPTGRYYLMFVPETESFGQFGLYDIDLNFMASVNDLTGAGFVDSTIEILEEPVLVDGTEPPPPDGSEPPPPPPDGTTSLDDPNAAQTAPTTSTTDPILDPPPPDDGTSTTEPPPPPPDGTTTTEPFPTFELALVSPFEIVGLTVQPEFFRFVFGAEVPNERFDSAGNPYFDDVNGNGVEDAGEVTADFRPTLFNADDWRSTDVSRYYRRATGGSVIVDEIDFQSREPRTFDGELLVARSFRPRLNAFKFGRPNSAINLLTTFLPPEFFDGTHSFAADTQLGVFQALAMINLVMEQMFNVEATIDIDGPGPFQPELAVIDAHLFVVPVGDPLVLILEGFESLSVPR